ncbi:glycerol-3-phosphate responsive antiterminator [Sporolactobacillus sp. THM7-4]|nr:glycerol-3-phosphate responsive antiterminator [Sporolactobacillus sp. THM7-4]
MIFNQKSVLPVVNSMKDFEKLLRRPARWIIVLDSHIAQVGEMVRMAKQNHKHIILHADMIHGLKNDEYAAEFICQNIRPNGIISTRFDILEIAKKRGLVTIQRIFLLDSRSLETSFNLFEKVRPDLIEVLPGIIPDMIREIHQAVRIPVIAGGLIRNQEEIKNAFAAGATAISTSKKDLWTFG